MSLFSDARNIVSLTTRHSDLALVGLLVAVIALMIMPLPTALVDTLIGANLALSFAIMMMSFNSHFFVVMLQFLLIVCVKLCRKRFLRKKTPGLRRADLSHIF